MNDKEDMQWLNLVALSAPTFALDPTPPYGFTTRFLAQYRTETRQRELVERIGMRALFASLGLLLLAAAVNFGVDYSQRADLEPGLPGLVQVENMRVS
jgi:hypothetical protein